MEPKAPITPPPTPNNQTQLGGTLSLHIPATVDASCSCFCFRSTPVAILRGNVVTPTHWARDAEKRAVVARVYKEVMDLVPDRNEAEALLRQADLTLIPPNELTVEQIRIIDEALRARRVGHHILRVDATEYVEPAAPTHRRSLDRGRQVIGQADTPAVGEDPGSHI